MAAPAKNAREANTDANSAVPSPRNKRKPPKLNRKQPSQRGTEEAEDQQQTNQTAGELSNTSPSEQPLRGAKDPEDIGKRDRAPDRYDMADETQDPEPEVQPVQQEESRTLHRQEKPFKDESETKANERQEAHHIGTRKRRTRRNRGQQDQQPAPFGDMGDPGNEVNNAGVLTQNTGTKAVNPAADSAGNVVEEGTEDLSNKQGKNDKEEQLRLRLDLNLDLEIQLKAKIHGDLTLQLLD